MPSTIDRFCTQELCPYEEARSKQIACTAIREAMDNNGPEASGCLLDSEQLPEVSKAKDRVVAAFTTLTQINTDMKGEADNA